MAGCDLPKVKARVRFPLPAPNIYTTLKCLKCYHVIIRLEITRRHEIGTRPLRLTATSTDEEFSRITYGLRREHITAPLAEANSLKPEEFRAKEWFWISQNVPELEKAARGLLELSLAQHNVTIDDAQLALSGTLLGGAVLRGLTDDGIISLQECRTNMQSPQLAQRGIIYDGRDIDSVTLAKIFEVEVVEGFNKIAHPPVRTMCSMVIGLALIPAN
jgi:hypothetical protein